MRELTRLMNWSFATLLAIYFFSACEKGDEHDTFIPFLTDRLWKGDTITINSPSTFEQLSIEDQQTFHTATSWFKNTQITLNEDGTVKSSGDFDPGYKSWRLVNNDADIEMTLASGSTLILRSWAADPFNFSYTGPFASTPNKSFDCTFNYK
ncbi:MAG TPA: hypothetical protein VGQ53_24940 [Chitinophagaceae bacterium]|jgi:hypothetical protein|nr:hypothetical protein [Chitinophagaceae bacterium]